MVNVNLDLSGIIENKESNHSYLLAMAIENEKMV